MKQKQALYSHADERFKDGVMKTLNPENNNSDDKKISTKIYILQRKRNGYNRYLISIDDGKTIYELSFFKGTKKQAHDRALFLLKEVIKKYCRLNDEEVQEFFKNGEKKK